MSLLLEDLIEATLEVQRQLSDDPPVLIGGLAVHLRTRITGRLGAPSEALGNPALLGSMIRPTQDIDLCVRFENVPRIEDVLRGLGFSRDPDPRRRFRFRKGSVAIDILTPEVRYKGLVFVEDGARGMASSIPIPGSRDRLRVGVAAALVVTIAVRQMFSACPFQEDDQ